MRAPTGDDTVGERPVVLDTEAVGAVPGEHVELDERTLVEEDLEPLPRRQLAAVVLALDRRVGAGVDRLFLQLGQLIEAFLQGHRGRDRCTAFSGCHAPEATSRP